MSSSIDFVPKTGQFRTLAGTSAAAASAEPKMESVEPMEAGIEWALVLSSSMFSAPFHSSIFQFPTSMLSSSFHALSHV